MVNPDTYILKMRIRIFVKSLIAQVFGLLILVAVFCFYEEDSEETELPEFQTVPVLDASFSQTKLPVSPYAENPSLGEFKQKHQK